ncbi:MAG: DNA-3-methyladenine glycosylase I [Qingshengfaniella sp.]
MRQTRLGPDGLHRCAWAEASDGERHYHDTEWGRPVGDDRTLFEKICLEGFQSGLSWRTVLDKRANFRAAFANFEIDHVAAFGPGDVTRLMNDAGIIRHRGKIEATLNNARRAQDLIRDEGSLAAYIWRYEPDPADLPPPQSVSTSATATALAKDLKKRGWKFFGPTTAHAFLQAMGLINDHAEGCALRAAATRARAAFIPPR